jgi:hypothetical protein
MESNAWSYQADISSFKLVPCNLYFVWIETEVFNFFVKMSFVQQIGTEWKNIVFIEIYNSFVKDFLVWCVF